MQSNQIIVTSTVEVTVGSLTGKVGIVTGVASKIPTPNSDLLIVSFDFVIDSHGSTSCVVPQGHLRLVLAPSK